MENVGIIPDYICKYSLVLLNNQEVFTMSELNHNKKELILISSVAIALLLSWLNVWKGIASFDFIALAATLIGGFPMYKEALESIKERRMTMELSMSIAVIATLSIGQFFTGGVITFFVLVAELLEHLTVNSGRKVIENLIELLPNTALIRRDGIEKEITLDKLRLQDIVIAKPGGKIPVDGVIIKGNSFVDQSYITGESLPVEKLNGYEVFAGTINQSGVLEIQVKKIGMDTTFGRIINIIEEAEKGKAPIQKLADKLSAYIVYVAFAGAIITYLVTHNATSSISALIVAGACGIAAGTPLAILAGIGRTAKEGIIVKGGVFLEQLAHIDTIVLDKTGTLTLGIPDITHIQSFGKMGPNEILRMAAMAEQHSEHPLASAVLKKARENDLEIASYSNIEYLPGKGIVCKTNGGDKILVGNTSLMEEMAVSYNGIITEYLTSRKEKGETIILVAFNTSVVGAISIADMVRNEAKEAVQAFKQFGCKVALLSGDSMNVTDAVGRYLEVDEYQGELLPEQKLKYIQERVKSGRKVAMIGDGINDAPALIEATVGIAMGSSTSVAFESADMILINNNLTKIVSALKISKQCFSVIMFNFWVTILVDSVGIICAALGYITPLIAVLIHVSSELTLILNSARLFRGKTA